MNRETEVQAPFLNPQLGNGWGIMLGRYQRGPSHERVRPKLKYLRPSRNTFNKKLLNSPNSH